MYAEVMMGKIVNFERENKLVGMINPDYWTRMPLEERKHKWEKCPNEKVKSLEVLNYSVWAS